MNVKYDNPYQALRAIGADMSSHESDLYVRYTTQAFAIVKASKWTYSFFRSAIDGSQQIEIPFAYELFWAGRAAPAILADAIFAAGPL